MVKLINGRGQLGDKLLRGLKDWDTNQDVNIYHTWKVPHLCDIKETEEEFQRKEYNKLVEFSINNQHTKIIFISTNSNRQTYYSYYKELAEAYLLLNHKESIILKFPVFVGNGILKKLSNGEMSPYGTMEVITLNKAVNTIKEFLHGSGRLKRVYTIPGEKLEAETIVEILNIK
tara:strand:+ start:1131 stop:1652 length:522 start_codon:yes stop_codon:yes gene_type:complete